MHLHKQTKPLAWFFFPFLLTASETWVLPLARGLNSYSGVWFRKSSFLSLAPLPNALQPCPIKIYSSHMFLVVTLCSATVGLLCTPRLLPRRSKPGNCCVWEDQPAAPRWTVNQALKAQPFKSSSQPHLFCYCTNAVLRKITNKSPIYFKYVI